MQLMRPLLSCSTLQMVHAQAITMRTCLRCFWRAFLEACCCLACWAAAAACSSSAIRAAAALEAASASAPVGGAACLAVGACFVAEAVDPAEALHVSSSTTCPTMPQQLQRPIKPCGS